MEYLIGHIKEIKTIGHIFLLGFIVYLKEDKDKVDKEIYGQEGRTWTSMVEEIIFMSTLTSCPR